ncbi:chondroitin sulfate synthase 1-like [Oculina patagonica]
MERVLRKCILFLSGLIVGFLITSFVRNNRCHLIYTRIFGPRTLTKPQEINLGNRQFIFVGVMTAEKFLETRAKAVFDTWGRNVAGKLSFFPSSGATPKTFQAPVVSLPDVDDSFPPLKKSLMMVKHMYDHHIDEYEWFMRADDDVYVRNDKLVRFLRSLNSSDDIYLGHAGIGKKEEREMLNLSPGENYCMGGLGVILSRSVLRKVGPHLEHCLQTAPKAHMHEDIELGNCIRRYAGVSCTRAFEMSTLFVHHNTGNGSMFKGDLNTKTINEAITLHPVKQPAYMYRLHSHFMNERIQDLQHKAVKLQRVLRNMDRLLQANGNELSLQEKRSLQDERDFHHQLAINNIEKWDMFTTKSFSTEISLKSPNRAFKIEVKNLLENTKELVDEEARKNQNIKKLKVQKLNHGYRRIHPLYGLQQIVEVTVNGKIQLNNPIGGRRFTYPSQRRRFFTQQPFGNLVYKTEPVDDMPPYVHFIVPLAERLETFRRFMKNFELVCLKTLQRVKLVVAYSSFVSFPHEHKVIMKEYQYKYPEAELIWLDVSGNFSRGIALSLAADKFDQTALLFLCDVDLIFNSEFIDRCRMNTALGKRVYFPIMFSQFDPDLTYKNKIKPGTHFTINKDAGIWRSYSYGPACIYHQDLDAVGGFDTSIKGWGLEDVDLYERFVNHIDIEVFRAADPGLIHVYHHVNCDPNLPARKLFMCQGSKASGRASQESLIRAMLSFQNVTHN